MAIYLVAHVALRLRNARSINLPRLVLALFLVGVIPAATELPSLATLAGVTVLLWALIAYETARYGEARMRLRGGPADESLPAHPNAGPTA